MGRTYDFEIIDAEKYKLLEKKEAPKNNLIKLTKIKADILMEQKIVEPTPTTVIIWEKAIETENKKQENQEKLNNQIKIALNPYGDLREFIKEFVKKVGVYYDEHKIWWIWDTENFVWRITDDTAIFNSLDSAINFTQPTFESKIKSEILELMKREGRRNEPEELPKTMIQFKGTIIDFKTEERIAATKKYFTHNSIPWEIGETEDTPVIDALFTDWLGEKYVKTLHQIIAFTIAREYFMNRIICLLGAGSNGKSKFNDLIDKFLGEHNVCSSDLENLSASRFETAKLYKKLVCKVSETEFSLLKKTSLLKQLSGNDSMRVEIKNKDSFDAKNYAKILISTNTLPTVQDKTIGFYRRWFILEFNKQFEERTGLIESIPEQEFNNLALKSIKLLKELYETCRFKNELEVSERAKAFEKHSNPLLLFISDECLVGEAYKIPFFEFFENIQGYLEVNKKRSMSKIEVSRILKTEGFEVKTESKVKEDGSYTTWKFVMGITIKQGQSGIQGW